MKQFIIAGNWKLNKSVQESVEFVTTLSKQAPASNDVDIIIAPPFTALHAVATSLSTSNKIKLAAQTVSAHAAGAYTGDVSATMLNELNCTYVIIGHSERRLYQQEDTTALINQYNQAIAQGITPIYCVGESLEQRTQGLTLTVIKNQLQPLLEAVNLAITPLMIAYEPVWAIGTNQSATPEQAQEIHAFIRTIGASTLGQEKANTLRLLYGGSVNKDNIATLLTQPDIDGALVGGASLDVHHFITLIETANSLSQST